MNSPETEREQQALDWVRRIADPGFTEWDRHILWLEQDYRNTEAFDRISLDMEAATVGLPAAGPYLRGIPVANDNGRGLPGRPWWVGTLVGGIAAAGLVALVLWPHHAASGSQQLITTLPGVSREIVLVDGSKVSLNGGSTLRIVDDRSLVLVDGEAYLEVVHHAADPFRLQAGGRIIEDVGTSFDVSVAPQVTRVAVHEGAVAIDPQLGNVRLTAGQEARIGADGDILRRTVAQDRGIGGWREGRLVYQEASWTEVVNDLNRSLGVRVSLAPGLAARRFTGVIMLDRDQAKTILRLANAAGISATRDGQGWRFDQR